MSHEKDGDTSSPLAVSALSTIYPHSSGRLGTPNRTTHFYLARYILHDMVPRLRLACWTSSTPVKQFPLLTSSCFRDGNKIYVKKRIHSHSNPRSPILSDLEERVASPGHGREGVETHNPDGGRTTEHIEATRSRVILQLNRKHEMSPSENTIEARETLLKIFVSTRQFATTTLRFRFSATK